MPWLIDSADRDALQRELLGATRERMLREMAEAVEALTAEAPLVLVLEDLHWSDTATVDLVSLLARRQEPTRLLLIGTYRPVDVIGSQHPLEHVRLELHTRGCSQELSLEPLSKAQVADYLRERFAGHAFPAELTRVINRRTEGNPLFMVSLVEDFVARGLIVIRDGRWKLHAVLEEVEIGVPENLREMIERRVRQLGEDERQVLAAGSVAGMEFSAASVAAALQGGGELRRAGASLPLHPLTRRRRVAGRDCGLALSVRARAAPKRALPGHLSRAASRAPPVDRRTGRSGLRRPGA